MSDLLKTSLNESHHKLGAKMAPFAGFEMPLQYNSVKEESLAVRQSAGVFDVSHMGEVFVTGPDAIKFLDHLVTNDFSALEMNKAMYSPLCNEDGKVIDDLIAYKLSSEKVLICVNASNIEKDYTWFEKHIENFDCKLSNQSDDYSLLALQGPQSEAILTKLEVYQVDKPLSYYSAIELETKRAQFILARTGYTGEDGFEIFGPHAAIQKLWNDLIAEGVAPCGLAARDVLRIEVCYPLYGHEITEELTPLDAALKWTVKMNKDNFIGKESLTDYTSKYRLVKLSLDKGIPRAGFEILNEDDDIIGSICSGTMSVNLGKGIGIGHVLRDKFPKNKAFKIRVRKNIVDATYHAKAFVTGGHK